MPEKFSVTLRPRPCNSDSDSGLWYGQVPGGNYYLVQGTWSVEQFTPSSNGTVNFAANLLSDGLVYIPINWSDADSSDDIVVTKPLSSYGMTNEFRLTGTLAKQEYEPPYTEVGMAFKL